LKIYKCCFKLVHIIFFNCKYFCSQMLLFKVRKSIHCSKMVYKGKLYFPYYVLYSKYVFKILSLYMLMFDKKPRGKSYLPSFSHIVVIEKEK